MNRILITSYLDIENIDSLTLKLVNNEKILIRKLATDHTGNDYIHVLEPKNRVIDLNKVIYFNINTTNNVGTDFFPN
ncbi:hypothetical protein [Staphylococcus devriesei]|uniref:Uncharacterized protein n=1 Tax=Staphylococcus devriesei TaxID=586733 RepID=A0A2T4KT02_9STAP|nr:hypothetical protein [Staphylococcus devriesei]PTF11991.1 hypothetical protein BUY48_09945 [Staphylococcus devriesei]